MGGFFATKQAGLLLDFAFFEFDMLARNRVIFPKDKLFCHRAGVFLGDIEKPGVSS